MNKIIYTIIGPTASGKTGKAVALAKHINGEIISADSRQVYRNMDLGTGKDLDEYGDVPYHLIDICEAGYKYNLYEFLRDYDIARDTIIDNGKEIIVCGGTGLYVESILNGYSLPEVPQNKDLRNSLADKSLEELTEILKSYKILHNKTDIDTTKRAIRAIEIQEYYKQNPDKAIATKPRPISNALIIGLDISRDERRARITQRLHKRLKDGMIDEVRSILDKGITAEDLIYYGLEYKFITQYVIGQLSYQQMVDSLEIAIHQFAKRQMTWFRGMEKRGFHINWLPYNMSDDEFIENVLKIRDSYQ